MITWNGKSSDDYGVIFETVPMQTHPARKVEIVSIPGRNGDLLIPENAWENYEQEYDIFAGDADDTAPAAFLNVASWLFEPAGYALLVDDFYPGYFRMAHFDGPFDVEFTLTRVGQARIAFNCKPQWYLNSGLAQQNYTEAGTITNPTLYTARPNIRVYGSGTVGIGSQTITIASHSWPYIDIDCEAMDARYEANNANNKVTVTGSDFPTLPAGDTGITLGGNVTRVQIQPRWWTI